MVQDLELVVVVVGQANDGDCVEGGIERGGISKLERAIRRQITRKVFAQDRYVAIGSAIADIRDGQRADAGNER